SPPTGRFDVPNIIVPLSELDLDHNPILLYLGEEREKSTERTTTVSWPAFADHLRGSIEPVLGIDGWRKEWARDKQKRKDNARGLGQPQTAVTASLLLRRGSRAHQDHENRESSGSRPHHQQGTKVFPQTRPSQS
ncbi:hypothetical protein ILUMI_16124, partial [Ignelater luminosus]